MRRAYVAGHSPENAGVASSIKKGNCGQVGYACDHPAVSCGDSLWPVQAYDYDGSWVRLERRSYERHVRKRPETEQWHEIHNDALSMRSTPYWRFDTLRPHWSRRS